jgi:hypothetical protein
LNEAKAAIAEVEKNLPPPEQVALVDDGGLLAPARSEKSTTTKREMPLRLRLDENAAASLRASYYDAVLEFEYRPTARGKLEVIADASRPRSEVGDFGVVADLNLLGPGEWQTARVQLFASNCTWLHRLSGGNDLEFRGTAEVRNVRLTATSYRLAR